KMPQGAQPRPPSPSPSLMPPLMSQHRGQPRAKMQPKQTMIGVAIDRFALIPHPHDTKRS
ncbi:MAG: hypothetical protein VXZ09_03500, partial [Pseudomonadota bacterium]|nr:hypothetical protein [Pseudomonadota bacterium]